MRQAVRNSSKDRLHQGPRPGRGSVHPARRGPRAPPAPLLQGWPARGPVPRQQEVRGGRHHPARPVGRGAAAATRGAEDGSGEDDFRFVLSREEYLDLFFDDLELPDLAKKKLATAESQSLSRAGYSTVGSPANMSLTRTMRNSLSRRIALKRPKGEDVRALEDEVEALAESGLNPERLEVLRTELALLLERTRRVSFVDPIDIRYRRFNPVPKPVAQAVMFCLMDTSASMTEHMKDLAKRFFSLLYIFLKRRYKNVDIVFIRHTHEAREVDEDTFFSSPETGGTVVSSALDEMIRVVEARYPPGDWNIYTAAGLGRRQLVGRHRTHRHDAARRRAAAVPIFRLSRGRPRERDAAYGLRAAPDGAVADL